MSLSTGNHTNPSDVLTRPKPSKKKSTSARKPNKKSTTGNPKPLVEASYNNTTGTEFIDDADLIDRLLGGLAREEDERPAAAAQPLASAIRSTESNDGLSQKIVRIEEEVKDVAHNLIAHLTTTGGSTKRRSRQKDRLARRQAAEDASREKARQEAQSLGPNANERKLESSAIEDACQALGLRMVEMNPDGHCLFSAIADQLNLHQVSAIEADAHTYQTCRIAASDYMRRNRDEFVNYLPAADDGLGEGLMSEKQYDQHCDQIRDSAQWGGEPEILALSKCFKFPIHIIQASTAMVKIGDDDYGALRGGKALMISYHRKSYGLGEHYNSLRPR